MEYCFIFFNNYFIAAVRMLQEITLQQHYMGAAYAN